jgi:hypothetical protein
MTEGCLLGEPDVEEAAQRVYAFGRPAQPGTVWRLRRVEPA